MRPIVLSLLGGFIVLANGLSRVYIPKLALFAPIVLVSVGLVSGAMMLFGGLMLWVAPRKHVGWGILIILFSASSLLIGGGLLGFLFPFGFTLGLLGGILALQSSPGPTTTSAAVR